MSQTPAEALDHPWVLYAAVILIISGFAVTVSKRLQEALGPIGRWISERQERAIERQRLRILALARLSDTVEEQLRADIREIGAQMNAQRRRHNEDMDALRSELADERAERASERTSYESRIEAMQRSHATEMADLRRQLNERGNR
ncbi:hypothetical protein R3Q06_17905 [Rhodococcus erythropolis]|uniref:hypothetical protein n=1 Tax=Rhodococcus erythropolis TaxID=1833 RepID=UPI002949B965|nr:hypothetical protein [Rhodococcus erythropolis]MDV6275372.1 hypothetical protein [Rhodococcus erythropolis]